MADSFASISAHKMFVFKVNPYNVAWGYNLRTHTDDTYGGKVVQILGTNLTTLTIDTVAGSNGVEYVDQFMKFWKDMAVWQQNTQKVATFSFPAKRYKLTVWAKTLTVPNSLDNVDHPISMTFEIQEDLGQTLTKTAMTDALKRMATGIGYTRNDYNYPSAAAEADFNAKLAAAAAATQGVGAGVNPNGVVTAVNGTDASLKADQQTNAQTIIAVALATFPGADGKKAAVIGIMAALAESGLVALDYGDKQNGVMTSSRGLFQQIDDWGPLADRMDPTKSATMFFTGGKAGQRGLQDIPNWQTLDPPHAAQAVQGSEFGDASNYQKQYARAQGIVNTIIGSSTTTTAQVGGTGVEIVIPNVPDVLDPSIRGFKITAPNDNVAKGIRAGLALLGLPYVYGGGDGVGGGPDHGSRDGNHSPFVGLDCSGLVGYVIGQMGYHVGGSYSLPQNQGGQQIPYAQVTCGDVIGYAGHTTIALGLINGTQYLLEEPEPGKNCQIKAVYASNEGIPRYSNVARYWI